MSRRLPVALLLLVTVSATTLVAQIRLVSVEQEIEIGRQANAQVRKEMPELRDSQVTSYIRSIGQRLVARAGGPDYPYSFSMANYREINAFALPGGPVWINRGVLHSATNESQIASVLAHEVAHISQRHAADQLSKSVMAQLGLGLLGAVLGNGSGASAAQMAAGMLANGVFLKFSRDDEREADQVGLRMMQRAGWDGRGMLELFEILQREASRNPSQVEMFFSSHPSPQDRIGRLRAEVRGNGTRDTQQFRTNKARLLKMPAPRAMPRD